MNPYTGTEAAASAAVTTAKIVVVLDHLKNNRIEYLILVAIGGSDKLDIFFIEEQSVYHIICELCDKEWIE